uniref:V-type proton ATPase subunit a n=1 Tax=Paramecium tetraurelia TaxID=5888 RepID=Q3SDC4_PARTE|nr:V-ATPase a subunit 6_2 isotype of the V0 sector [Paramecium tetraurelia]
MSFFRSKQMKYYSLVIPRESAWMVMDQLGRLGQLHMIDYDPLLPMMNRPFANYVKRCDEALFKLIGIESLLKQFKKNLIHCEDTQKLLDHFRDIQNSRQKPGHTYFDELEQEIERKKNHVQEIVDSITEQKLVLEKAKEVLGNSMFSQAIPHNVNDYQQLKFGQLIGVIDKEDETRFKRIMFRITKGNAWVNIVDLLPEKQHHQIKTQIDLNRAQQPRCLYVVVYPGMNDQSTLKQKLLKVCDSFAKNRIEYPNSQEAMDNKLRELSIQINEALNLIQMTKKQLDVTLDEFVKEQNGCNCSYFEQLRLYVLKEKYLYVNLNYLMMQGSIFTGYFWLPEGLEAQVEDKLRNAMQNSIDRFPTGQIQEMKPKPGDLAPTYFKLNEVTMPFQEIVNTYGVPRYQEVNPGLFTVITFPFLFGVMFADIAHGFLLLLCGLYVIVWKNQLKKETDSMFNAMIPFRYLLALMGLFAFYNGLIYNDYLSISLDLFGSCYYPKHEEWEREQNCVYPFGIDPVWLASGSSLNFMNSYKMKLAVILGVIHMLFGILMKGANTLYFRNYLDFFCEFIPQLLFMACTFGWMDFLIIMKWLNVYPNGKDPSIIETMINQVLKPMDESATPVFPDNAPLQLILTQWLTVIALVSIPWMLLPKPLILGSSHKKHKVSDPQLQKLIPEKQGSEDIDPQQFRKDLQFAISSKSIELFEQEHDSGEIWVHQMIETIEFVLGGISNTASYLRLWALSLAHGQLAEVFYDMCIAGKLDMGGIIGGLMSGYFYIVFALLTFGVLMMMDVMECFLHALRLHWVEFQSKFYKADGYLFVGYSYNKILTEHLK